MNVAIKTPVDQSLEIMQKIEINASIETTFETLLEQLGPENFGEGPMPMKLEPWPGGRWYRDLGNDDGHLWGHVQVIKRPYLLEMVGPMFMSYAVASHVQYRLVAEGDLTTIALRHTAFGMIPNEHREGVVGGWNSLLDRVKSNSEQ